MLKLPDITLVVYDIKAHELTRRAIEDCVSKAKFGEVIIWSDDDRIMPSGIEARFIRCPADTHFDDYARLVWYGFPAEIHTSHYLLHQYDSWIINPSAWSDDFLAYDFVGAPWWYNDENNVGCGGFGLTSMRLANFLAEHKNEFPMAQPEDHVRARVYGKDLKAAGMRFAPEHVAYRFARERTGWDREGIPFGFHGIWNWPRVLSGAALAERMALANDYVRRKSEWHEMLRIIGR